MLVSLMQRRANKEGTLHYLPNGKVRASVMIDKKRRYTHVCETASEALREVKKLNPAVRKQSQIPTLEDYYLDNKDGRLADEWEVSTWQLCETIARVHLIDSPLGRKQIHRIETEDVEEWRDAIKAGNAYKNRAAAMVAGLLRRAIKEYRLKIINPADAVESLDVAKTHRLQVRMGDLNKFLACFKEQRLQLALRLMLKGMRRGEACGTKFEDIEGNGIWVKRQIQEPNGKLFIKESTKTDQWRWVPLDDELLKLIWAQGRKEGWILATSKGTAYRPHNVWRDMKDALEKTKWADLTLHGLRGTFCSFLLQSGVDVRTAADITGHSPAVMASIYAQSTNDSKEKALALVNKTVAETVARNKKSGSKKKGA